MKFVFTPDWFLGGDIGIDAFSFLVLIIFFALSVRSYRISKNKSSLYLGIGFLLIAIAELSTILTKLVLYYDVFFTHQIGQMIVTYKVVNSVDFFYKLGFFFHRLFTLAGFYLIYKMPSRKEGKKDTLLVFYLFAIISLVSSDAFYYFFHTTALILLIYIIMNYNKIYQENKSSNTKILIIAFSLLALSQGLYILSKLAIINVIAQVIQLVSYLILLILIIRIVTWQRKKEAGQK